MVLPQTSDDNDPHPFSHHGSLDTAHVSQRPSKDTTPTRAGELLEPKKLLRRNAFKKLRVVQASSIQAP